jgi:hypothetical protein
MRKLLVTLVLLASSFPAICQQQLDAATKEDVEQLMELTGSRQRIQQIWAAMAQQAASTAADSYRLKHPDATPLELRKVAEVTGEYMQTVIKSFSVDEIIEAIIPVYQRHLTHADVQSVISFYNSGPGQKLLKEMPTMMAESMQVADPIIKKHLPEMQAAAEKAIEEQAKAAVRDSSGATPK